MSKNNWRGSSDPEKYGEKTKTWINRDDEGKVKQYNVKDLETGDHHFTDLKTGRQGVALSDYRPDRDKKK